MLPVLLLLFAATGVSVIRPALARELLSDEVTVML